MSLSMGFYQLSRLYYCFANNQIHSDKGYPKWLFNIMYIIGVIICLNYAVSNETMPNFSIFNSKCGINDKFEFYYHSLHIINTKISVFYPITTILCFYAWDLFTLYLYISKIRTFRMYKDKDPSVYKRIQSILQKIFILTTFYQIAGFFYMLISASLMSVFGVASIIGISIMAVSSLTFSLSMYLMMDHNRTEYLRFLKILQYLKLNYLCCKWRYFVLEQIEELDENVQTVAIEMNMGDNIESQIETRNETVMNHEIEMPDISVASIN